MAESAGYQAEQAAEQDQSGGGFRAWFVAHERTVLIVGLLGIGVTIFLFWRGKGSSQASSNTVPGSGGIPTASVTDSSTAQALNSLTQAISNLLGQLGGNNGGGGNGSPIPPNPTGPPTPAPIGGGGSYADFVALVKKLGAGRIFQNPPTIQQQQAWAVYQSGGPSALTNWLQSQGLGSGTAPAPQQTRPNISAALPMTQQQHYPLGALAPRPVLPAAR